jgi:hypothetical protein
VKVIFRLMLLGGITIIVIAFYMRIYCHDHTSLSTQTPNIISLIKLPARLNRVYQRTDYNAKQLSIIIDYRPLIAIINRSLIALIENQPVLIFEGFPVRFFRKLFMNEEFLVLVFLFYIPPFEDADSVRIS